MYKIKELFEKSGCDAIVIPSQLSCRYYTGYDNDFCFLVATKDYIRYYTDLRCYDEVKKFISAEVILINGNNALDIISKDLSKYNCIGIDESNVYYREYINLTKAIGKDEIKNISELVYEQRLIKDADELLETEAAVFIADTTFKNVLPLIKEGITEKELGYIIDSELIINGADNKAFDTIVAFQENASHPHWHKSHRKLKYGDCILMDFGAKCNGYHSDMTRVVTFGNAQDEFKEIYNIVLEANQRAIDNIFVDMIAKDADAIARDYIASKGYRDNFIHSLGHGTGIEIHESPSLSKDSEMKLSKGMVFSIEPGIYIPNKFGVRIEDLVFLTDKAYQLTKSDKNLIEL